MTKEDIKELGIEEVETRAAEIAEELGNEEIEAEKVEALNEELDALDERNL